jgi:hypothetical protein
VGTRDTLRIGNYIFFLWKEKRNSSIGNRIFVHDGIVSAVTSAELVSDRGSFERAETFKYLGANLTYQNSIQEEIKNKLRSGSACFHSAQKLLSSNLLSKNIKIEIYRTIILPVILYGCGT